MPTAALLVANRDGAEERLARHGTCSIGQSMNGVGRLARATYRVARRIVISVVGGTLVLLGVILIFTPGPAFVVLPLGLGVLAIEFAWARRWLKRVRAMVTGDKAQATASATNAAGEPQSVPARPGNGTTEHPSATG